jgi:hypothetical protein
VPDLINGGSKVIAFRSNNSCSVWQYIPGQYIASGDFIHVTDFSNTKFGQDFYLTYLTAIETMAYAGYNAEDLMELKRNIYDWSKRPPEKGRPDLVGNCRNQIAKPEDVFLNAQLVRQTSVVTSTNDVDSDTSLTFFSKLGPTYGSKPNFYSDPNNSQAVTFSMDASNENAVQNLKKIQRTSHIEPYRIGYLGMILQGVLARVNSHLYTKGQITAEFASAVHDMGCDNHNEKQNLGIGAIGPGFVGGGLAGYTKEVKNCLSKLLTVYKAGKFHDIFEIVHLDSQFQMYDGKPIMFKVCDEKEGCTIDMPLQDYVENRLVYQFLLANIDTIMKIYADRTLEVTLGKQGENKTDFVVDMGYLSSLHGTMSIMVPVTARNLNKNNFDFSPLESQTAKCFQKSYESQAGMFKKYQKISAMPVNEECISGKK